jgi:autotransporter-associated beta strand protein
MKSIALLFAAALAVFGLPSTVNAATYTWSGQGFMSNQNFLWSDNFNWVGLAAPASGETNVTIVLPNSGAPRTTTNDIPGLVIKSIRFQGDNYIVAGKSPGNTMTLRFDRFAGDAIEVSANNCQFAPTMTLVLTNDITIDVNVGNTFHMRAPMTGPGGVTKIDLGTLHFNSPGNNYLGDTFITDGIVDLECGLFGPSIAIPGPLFIGGTNLNFTPVVRLQNDNQLSDTAPIVVNANAKLWLNTHDDVVSSLTLNGGLVNTGLGGGSSTPGVLQLNGNVTNNPSPVVNFATISGKLSLGTATRTFNITGGQLGIDAVISDSVTGNPGIIKIGPGTLSLYNATNTYIGSTIVQDGILEASGTTQPFGTTNFGTIVSQGAQLRLNSVAIGREALTLNGAVTNDVLLFAGSNNWSGPVSIVFARINGASNQVMNFGGVVSGGTFKMTGRGEVYFTGTTANTVGDVIVDRGVLYLAKTAGIDAFGGRLFVGNSNDPIVSALVIIDHDHQMPAFAPVTIFSSGYVSFDFAQDAIGHLTLQGGWLAGFGGKMTLYGNITNTVGAQSPYLFGEFILGNFQRTIHCVAGSTLEFAGTIQDPGGNGGITKTGPGRLVMSADDNSYTGPTLVQEGFLMLKNDGRPGAPLGGLEVFSPAVLQLDRTHVTNELLTLHGNVGNYSVYVRDQCAWAGNVVLLADSGVQFENANGLTNKLQISGAISGPGGLTVDGDGELILSGTGDNTFAGPLWLRSSEGTLIKTSGATAISSTLRVGDNAGGLKHHTKLGANNQIANNSLLEIRANGDFTLNGFNETVGALSLTSGRIAPSPGIITITGNITNRAYAGGASAVYSHVSLGGATRTISTEPNSFLSFYGDIQDGGAPSGVTITGGGEVAYNYVTTYGGTTLVNASTLDLNGNATPGSSTSGTQISPGGHLNLLSVRITNETLLLYGDAGSSVLTFETASNVWSGPIQLLGDTTFLGIPETFPSFAPAKFWINGAISGSGALTLDGRSDVVFWGDNPNIYTNKTTVKTGTLYVGKNSVVPNNFAIPGNLIIGTTNNPDTAQVTALAKNQFATGSALRHTVDSSGTLSIRDFDQRVPAMTLRNTHVYAGSGLLTLTGDVTVDDFNGNGTVVIATTALGTASGTNGLRTISVTNGAVIEFYSEITNGVSATNLMKAGPGFLYLSGSNTFSGAINIAEGVLRIFNPNSLGTKTGPTFVGPKGNLDIVNWYTNTWRISEPLFLAGEPNGPYSLYSSGTNILDGAIQLLSDSTIYVQEVLTIAGSISGPNAGLKKLGEGLLRLTGTISNTFTGTMSLADGSLDLVKTNATAIPGPLNVGNGFSPSGSHVVRWFQPNQVADASAVDVKFSGRIELQNNDETIGSLAGSGFALLGNATLTTGGDGSSTGFTGFIAGIGGQLTKTGAGTMILTGNNTYTGTTTVNQGVLLVNGQQSQSPVSLVTGGQIGGTGPVGNISALNGHTAPGANVGKLSSGNLSFFSPSSLLKIDINGTAGGTNYDQVDVTGNVLLMGGSLAISMNIPGAVSNQYVIVKNDGVEPVNGTFTGVTNGASITNNGTIFVVKYNGGDGNDIVLIQQNIGVGPQIGGIQNLGGGRMSVSAIGIPNISYTAQATVNLNAPITWITLGTVLSDNVGQIIYVDNEAGHYPMRFYRFRLP